jgi:hypothetical protein
MVMWSPGKVCAVGDHSSGRNDGRTKVTRDSSKTRPGDARGALSVRPSLSGQVRPGALSLRTGAASLIAVVALLEVAGCGGSGLVAGNAAGSPATSAVTGRSRASGASASAVTGAERAAVPEPAHTVVVVRENPFLGRWRRHPGRAVHQRAGPPRRAVHPLRRDHPSGRTELAGTVLRPQPRSRR